MELLFKPGAIGATPKAARFLYENGINPGDLLSRHFTGDWGQVDDHDKAANNAAVRNGTRVLSEYKCPIFGDVGSGNKQGGVPTSEQLVWIITEADRSSTTILLPEEY